MGKCRGEGVGVVQDKGVYSYKKRVSRSIHKFCVKLQGKKWFICKFTYMHVQYICTGAYATVFTRVGYGGGLELAGKIFVVILILCLYMYPV